MKNILIKLIGLLKKKVNKDSVSLTVMQNGVERDAEDERDYILPTSSQIDLPVAVSLKEYCPPVKNQGYGNSCVAHWAITAYETMMNIQGHPHRGVQLSEMFVWYKAREVIGLQDTNSGCFPRDMCKVMLNGATLESLCPYDLEQLDKPPSSAAYWFRNIFKISEYYRAGNLTLVKTALSQGLPVGLTLPMKIIPTISPINKGYHQVMIVAYCDIEQKVLINNSWGSNWDSDGYFEMTYKQIEKYLWETWVMIL